MRIDFVWHWSCNRENLPDKFQGVGPFELTMEDIESLSQQYDVMIHSIRMPQPTKKQLRHGAQPVPDRIGLYIDQKHMRFSQR